MPVMRVMVSFQSRSELEFICLGTMSRMSRITRTRGSDAVKGVVAIRPVGGSRRPLGRVSTGNEQAKGKRGGLRSTSWKPGCPSPNPGGRPATSYRASEAVRELVDPAAWIAFELGIANDEKQPIERRRDSWRALIDRGFCRPATDSNLNVSGGAASADFGHLAALPLDERRALLAKLRGEAEPCVPTPDPRLLEPQVTDEEPS